MIFNENNVIITKNSSENKVSSCEDLTCSLLEMDEEWYNLNENMMILEHEALDTNNAFLLEDGKKIWIKKAKDWFLTVFERISSFSKEILNHIKDFDIKSKALKNNFIKPNKLTNKDLETLEVNKNLLKEYKKFEDVLSVDLSVGGDNLDKAVKGLSNIKDPRKKPKIFGYTKLDMDVYETCYDFVKDGRNQASKKIKEFEKASQETIKMADVELSKLEKNPIDFNIKKLNDYRKRLRNIQIMNTVLVRNMDYFTIMSYQVCVDVAKKNMTV